MNRCVRMFAFCVLLAPLGIAQAQRGATAKLKFKAIWEPVNYKEDLPLFEVFFVSKEEGWVSGGAGTILHTKDGGNSWTAEHTLDSRRQQSSSVLG